MKLSFVRSLAALAVIAVPLAGVAVSYSQAQTPAPAAGEKKAEDVVVATVNGQKIMRSEVEMMAASLPPQYRQMPLQLIFPALLDQVINTKLVAGEGRKQGLQNDPEVKRRMAMIEDRLVQDAYEQKELTRQITPAALKARYDKQVAGMGPEEEVNARHILVKTEDEARAVIADLKKNGDFAKIAKEKSTDTGSGANGGDLGWFTPGMMVPPFAQAVAKLDKGQISEPVQTPFGWHVILLEDVRDATPPSMDELKPQIAQMLQSKMVNDYLEKLKSGAKIEVTEIQVSAAVPAADAAKDEKK